VLAFLVLRTLVAIAPSDVPRLSSVGLDARMLLVAIGSAAGIALLFSLVPIAQAKGAKLPSLLKSEGRITAGRGRPHASLDTRRRRSRVGRGARHRCRLVDSKLLASEDDGPGFRCGAHAEGRAAAASEPLSDQEQPVPLVRGGGAVQWRSVAAGVGAAWSPEGVAHGKPPARRRFRQLVSDRTPGGGSRELA
jgi:hypothetical protein